jgi:spermidine synthase
MYTSPSGIKVYQNYFYRWLTTNSSAIQTLINRRHPGKPLTSYVPAMLLQVSRDPASVCLLGLGGGAVLHAIASRFPQNSIHAVELSQEIIDIAHQFFEIKCSAKITITHQDAKDFVRTSNLQYKHLLVDLFDSHHYPAQCNNYEFFKNCRRILNNEGIMALNLANPHEQWSILNLIREVFEQKTICIPIPRAANLIVIASNHTSIAALIGLFESNHSVLKIEWHPRWGCIMTI